MTFRKHELEVCHTDEAEFLSLLSLLETEIDGRLGVPIRKRDGLDITTILRTFACAAIVRRLVSRPGFKAVTKRIVEAPNVTLWEPHGPWFHLLCAYVFDVVIGQVQMEREVHGAPKDAYLPNPELLVECKSSESGGRSEARREKWASAQDVPQDPVSEETAGFQVTMDVFPKWPWGPQAPLTTSHFDRFVGNALADKHHQLVDGIPSIVATNINRISNRVHPPRETVERILQSDQFPRLSGVLMIRERASLDSDYSRRGEVARIELASIPRPSAAQVPQPVLSAFQATESVLVGIPATT